MFASEGHGLWSMVKEGDLHRLAKNVEDAEAKELHRVFADDGPMNHPEPQIFSPSPLCVTLDALASGRRDTSRFPSIAWVCVRAIRP